MLESIHTHFIQRSPVTQVGIGLVENSSICWDLRIQCSTQSIQRDSVTRVIYMKAEIDYKLNTDVKHLNKI